MKKRLTALLLTLALLSALAVGIVADEQTGESGGTETAQTAPDAAGTLSFENLDERMRTKSYSLLLLEENIAAIESMDYDKLEEELRDKLNETADSQWKATSPDPTGNPMIDAIAPMLGQSSAAMLQQQYDAYREAFDAIRDGELQKDNADRVRQIRATEDKAVMTGETLYITILGMEEQSAALARQDAALGRTVEELELRYQLGQISAMTLQQTKSGREQMQSGKATLDVNIASLRRQLNAMVGEDLTAPLTLGALPTVTAEQLAAIDVEKDLERAKNASYDLYAAKLALDDADEEFEDSGAKYNYSETDYKKVQAKHTWQAAQYTYNAAVQNFELSFRSLYDSVKDCAQILTAAQTALECERADLAAAQLKYEQGTISANALHTAEDDLYTAQDTVSSAERDLFTAYNNYRWAVDRGLLNG